MKKLVVLFFVLCSFIQVFSQHLPLQIDNQWHYNMDFMPPGIDYAAMAVDTIQINNTTYFKIERRNYLTGNLFETTYDRLEGDSCYYRIRNGQETLIMNFNWPDGYRQVTPSDSNCIDISVLNRGFRNIWGFNTESFDFNIGFWCTGFIDTAWLLQTLTITKDFGCYYAGDGYLQGAIINGITYGILHPLPVELLSFSSSVLDNDVTLNWTTATETNNSGFEIQKLKNSKIEKLQDWEMIGFVNGHGTTTEPQTYSYKDENLKAGKYQYRLKQIDFDGTYEYSNIIEVAILPPAKFSLEQNFPNPFNPSSTIKWQTPKEAFQTLKVFDVLGNEVATLVNEELPAGEYEVDFDGATLTSGIYFYQLKVGEFIQTKKMTILK